MKKIILSLLLFSSTLSAHAQQRIISAGYAVTQTLVALGVQKKIVATDDQSQLPSRHVKHIGYIRTLPIEGILALNPSLVILSDEAGPRETIQELKHAGIPILQLGKVSQYQQARKFILSIGEATERIKQAQKLVDSMQQQYQQFLKHSNKRHPSVLPLLDVTQNGSYFLLGAKTYADQWLHLVGVKNAARKTSGLQAFNLESLISLKPNQIIIFSNNPKRAATQNLTQVAHMLRIPVKVVPAKLLAQYGVHFVTTLQTLQCSIFNK